MPPPLSPSVQCFHESVILIKALKLQKSFPTLPLVLLLGLPALASKATLPVRKSLLCSSQLGLSVLVRLTLLQNSGCSILLGSLASHSSHGFSLYPNMAS